MTEFSDYGIYLQIVGIVPFLKSFTNAPGSCSSSFV